MGHSTGIYRWGLSARQAHLTQQKKWSPARAPPKLAGQRAVVSAARHGVRSRFGYRTAVAATRASSQIGCPGGGKPSNASSRGVDPSTNSTHAGAVASDWAVW